MESENPQAPPVVAVVVVNDPGPWFGETLDALAAQDYPNIRFLFLDTSVGGAGTSSDVVPGEGDPAGVDQLSDLIHSRLPDAFVRRLGSNPGFGPAANEVLRLVEGDNGFFLVCHDDVAPDPSAVRLLVEELYRSNAGVVGPKLVDWDDPRTLQSVGLGLDRFGEVDVGVEPGEVDQEQHDGVRDVFVIPSAFLLVRADLFRTVGGFDAALDYHGEDVDLCWRVHLTGARVVVVPSARVRHGQMLRSRRPDLPHRTIEARHRMRAVATLTGAARLPGRSLELVLLTLTELVVGLFTGRFGEAWASLRALGGLIPRTPSILRRRAAVKPIRRVPEREVTGLQERGSTRLNHYLRSRDTTTFVGAESSVRRWRESAAGPAIAWIVVFALLLVGSRSLLSAGIPPVREFLPLPASAGDLVSAYGSSWNALGIGTTAPNPTGWVTIALASVTTLFRMGLFHTVMILGLVIVGLSGMGRLVRVFPSTRARVAGMLVYAASPLVSGALSIGSLNTLVVYAATPWMIHLMRRAAGVETADPRTASDDVVDGIVELDPVERVRRMLLVAIVVALATAFVPFMVVICVLVGLVLAIGTLLALASWRTALGYAVVGLVAAAVAVLLNVPWFSTWTWAGLVGPPPIGDPGRGLLDVAAFEIGVTDLAYLSLALYVPVLAALLLARAWRLTWAVRATVLVVSFGALAVLADRGDLPFRGPEAGILLVPVAVGLAIAGGAALAAFDLDIRDASFGWRQPLGLAASAAIVVGLVPGLVAVGDGAWNMPEAPLASLLDRRFTDTSEGSFNVLMVGDARVLPVPATEYRDGISWAIANDGELDMRDRWVAPDNDVGPVIADVLDQIASGSTQRAGQLLAPLGIRYVMVPEFDGVSSTTADPLPLPEGLTEALDSQLDIVSIPGLPTLELYENRAWIPAIAQLTGDTAAASNEDGVQNVIRSDLTMATPVFGSVDALATETATVEPGAIHLAVPFDENWKLSVDGVDLPARPSFGLMTAFDVTSAGTAELSYDSSGSRALLVGLQTVLWLLVLFGATRVGVPLARRQLAAVSDETLIDLDAAPGVGEGSASVSVGPLSSVSSDATDGTGSVLRDPGLDATGELARPDEAGGP